MISSVQIELSPESIDDIGSAALARDIARKVEEDLVFPGQIKVTVIRETRAVDIAGTPPLDGFDPQTASDLLRALEGAQS